VIPVPTALEAHLAEDVTTLCHCWVLTRRDGATLGFTDHDRPVDLGTATCMPDTGFTPGEAESALGLGIGMDAVEGALRADAISADDLAAGLYDGASITTFLVNWMAPAQFVRLREATIARIEQADGAWRAEIEDLAAELNVPRGRLVRRHCDAELGDSRCGVDLKAGGLELSGTVLAIGAPFRLKASGLAAAPAGRFSGGTLTFTSGARAGTGVAVAIHEKTASEIWLTLVHPLADGIAAGDGFTVTAGCDKTFATCKAVYANALNFRGFPHLPGNDSAYAYANQNTNADGGPVVP
jgi:uncharacterized phage protein (TIGR02218 family)